jgi:pantoate--beta-alanine ligase
MEILKMTQVVEEIAAVRRQVAAMRADGHTVALVPTMGYLHDGHMELVRRAKSDGHRVCVSIFVNPTQFGPGEDLDRYPHDFEGDLKRCEAEGVELIFAPAASEIYAQGHQTVVKVEELSKPMCGLHRPAHFAGVATVVLKLFNIVCPEAAYFGEKDFQQLQVIKRLVYDLNVPVAICPVPTVREADGLAMSSRNKYLSTQERAKALSISEALALVEKLIRDGETDAGAIVADATELMRARGVTPEYLELRDPDTLEAVAEVAVAARGASGATLVAIAARVGTTRLIDNRVVIL